MPLPPIVALTLVSVTTLAVWPFGRKTTVSRRSPTSDPPAEDLISNLEHEDYVDAAKALEARRNVEAEPADAQAPAQTTDDIEWSEAGAAYRPPTIEPSDLLQELAVRQHPELTTGRHHVFVASATLEQIYAHLASNTAVELGGLLAGKPYYAPSLDAYLIVITQSLRADCGKETPVSFEYTSETWREMTPKLQEIPQECVIVGSYHSHPGLGVFLSPTDIDTQINVFPQEWQVALVVDPIRSDTGFFISQAGVKIQFTVFD